MFTTSQAAFTSGEWAEELYARVDIEQFGRALKTAFNVIIHKQGGASAFAGTKHVCTVPDSAYAHRAIPFEFNTEQAYITLWGNQDISIIKDGELVLEDSQDVLGITQASPGVVHVAAHTWADGDLVYSTGIGGMSALNARYYTIDVTDADHFTLKDLYGTAINTSALPAWTAGGVFARVHRVGAASVPYTSNNDPNSAAIFYMDFAQSNDEGYAAHLSYAPRILTRSGHAAWTMTTQVFATTLAAPAGVTATATVGAGAINYNYVVTAINDLTGEESLASVHDDCVNDLSADPTYKNTIAWSAVANATRYSIYKEENGLFGFIGGTTGLTFVDGPGGGAGGEITPDLSITPPLNFNPFNGADNYPAAVEFHEARLAYGQMNSNPGVGWMSQPTRFSNFNRSVPARSDDVVGFRLLPGVNAIQGFASLGDKLFCATSSGEFTIAGSGVTGYITPASAAPRLWSRRGSDRLKPLVIGEHVLFVQKQGKSIYAFGRPIGGGNDMASTDLTVLAPHLFEGHYIVDWCYQQDPHGIAYLVRDDGILILLTFLAEFQMFAFARAEIAGSVAGAAVVESCACVSGPDEDEVYLEVKRTINGGTRRHVEMIASLNWGTDIADYWGLHDALLFDGAPTNTFDNNWHLEGETQVAAFADGFMVTGLTCTNGRVTLSSADFPDGASKVLIGLLPEAWELEPLPVAQPNQKGAPQGKRKRVVGVTLKLKKSCGVYAGSNAATLHQLKMRKPSVPYGMPTPPFSGDIYSQFDAKYSKDGTFLIRGTPGMPAHVLALYPVEEQSDAKVKLSDS